MKTVVLIKQVPDTYGSRRLNLDGGAVDRAGSEAVIDEIDERALAAALQIREEHGGDVTVLSMGPAEASKSLRKCLATGADRAIHIIDEQLAGSDSVQTSAALAAALRPLEFDLIIAGNESTDGRAGAVPAMLAERLALPQLTFLRKLDVSKDGVSGERVTEEGYLDVSAGLPALVSVTESVAEPRYPGLKGILAARKKPLTVVTVVELGLSPDEVGGSNSWSRVRSVTERPARTAGTVITDDGTAGTQLFDFLAAAKLI